MASSARRIVIEFLGDDKSASRVARSVDGTTSRLGDTFKRVGKAAAVGLGAGLVVAAAGMVKATQAAIEDEAAAVKLATALKNATGATDDQIAAVEDYITKTSIATGVADDELRPAFQRLAEATGDVAKAQDLLSLAMDVSAGTGKSLESVSTALMKAQNGSVSGLSRLGVATKDAAGETLSFDKIQQNLAKTFGGQAAVKADTMAGKMDRLKVMFNETMEAVGYKLIPIVTKLADVFVEDVVPALQEAAAWFGEHVQPRLEELGRVVQRVFSDAARWVSDHMDEIKETIATVVDTVRVLWDRFGENILNVVQSKFDAVKNVLKGAFQVIRGIFRVFHGIITGDWKEVWNGIKDIFKGVWTAIKAIVKDAWTTLKESFKAAGGVLKDVMSNTWDGIKDAARNGLDWLIDSVKALPEKIKNAAGDLFENAGKFLINGFVDGMKNAAGLVSDIAGNVWDAVKGLLNDGIDKINSALEFTIHGPGPLPDVTVNPPDIPHLYSGARNFGGLAVVGEQGPELVSLPRGSDVYSASESRRMARGGSPEPGITIVVNGALDPNAVAQQIEAILTRHKRLKGNTPLAFA